MYKKDIRLLRGVAKKILSFFKAIESLNIINYYFKTKRDQPHVRTFIILPFLLVKVITTFLPIKDFLITNLFVVKLITFMLISLSYY